MIADVTAYTVAKFAHVMLAIVWIGGATVLQLIGRSALASTLPGRRGELAAEMENLGKKVFTPCSILVLLLGIYLTMEGDWGFDSLWISLAMLGILISIVTGAGYLGPQIGKVRKAVQGEGADSPTVRDGIAKILRVSLMDLGLLVFIVFLMVTKLGD